MNNQRSKYNRNMDNDHRHFDNNNKYFSNNTNIRRNYVNRQGNQRFMNSWNFLLLVFFY